MRSNEERRSRGPGKDGGPPHPQGSQGSPDHMEMGKLLLSPDSLAGRRAVSCKWLAWSESKLS
jgi:hypothetical protein